MQYVEYIIQKCVRRDHQENLENEENGQFGFGKNQFTTGYLKSKMKRFCVYH